jgi:acetyl/propionyl-CoA carboxylase alpha subunit
MIAKIIVHGQNRSDAIAKLFRALGETVIDGVETTIPYHQALLKTKAFHSGEYTTRFVEENESLLKEFESKQNALSAEAALAAALKIHLKRSGASTSIENNNLGGITATSSNQETTNSEIWKHAHRLEATRR